MREPLVLVTGFGPFPGTRHNPSREIARLLAEAPPAGVRVSARELPVTFRGAPEAVRAAVAELAPERPRALLGLGVQPEPWFRLGRCARGRYDTERVDNDGLCAAKMVLTVGEERRTELDLESLADALRVAGAPDVRVSDDAGGYVCEAVCRVALEKGAELGVPALFLHVPPIDVMAPEEQLPKVAGVLAAMARVAGV